jgi:hypothetical protein
MGQAGVEPTELDVKKIAEMVVVAKPIIMRVMETEGRYTKDLKNIEKQGVAFDLILRRMPREWRTETDNPWQNEYGAEMAIAIFNAISELIEENKLKYCLYLEHTGHMMEIRADGISNNTPMGFWRLGIMLA